MIRQYCFPILNFEKKKYNEIFNKPFRLYVCDTYVFLKFEKSNVLKK